MTPLDECPKRLDDIINGDYSYPLTDFLYFSAITITTVGFGDILPNNTYVRSLVMLESLLGLILIDIFVSFSFAALSSVRAQIDKTNA